MEVQVLIGHNEVIYDATPIILEGLVWESNITGSAGELRFSLKRDGITEFTEGDCVLFLVDGLLTFMGYVVSKERTSAQIISVVAYDQLFYMGKNIDSMVYWNQTATQILQTLAEKHGFVMGDIADTEWIIPQRIEAGQSILDIIYSALDMTQKATGNEFFLYDVGGMLYLQNKTDLMVPVMLGYDGGISEYYYKTDISEDTYNSVALYYTQDGEKQVVYVSNIPDKIEEWGGLQYVQSVEYGLNAAQMELVATEILAEKGRVSKSLVVENINGDYLLRAGYTIGMYIPDLAEIGIDGAVLIESCEHTFSDGMHKTKLTIRMEDVE
ncbi:hypothetical protein [Chakrabartyella piscis]|uniref:XkdQ/YqbQ family protein n=1 Tax=Chakrabartyella piscis TaxID=2918914 RepID=UPI002958D336|nr:hypothetical protein [Chakrabartyella piscis]